MNKSSDTDGPRPSLTAEETGRTIIRNLPPVDHHGEIVEAVGPNSVRLRLPFEPKFVGTEPWGDGDEKVFSGPMVMGFADTAMYCCVMAAMGLEVIPVMVNININFVLPAAARDLIAEARIIRRGGRLHYLECWITADGAAAACAHITSTYRVARRAE
jgi:acyl-coenzyme A thioesterase PaaI-like protein